MKVLAISLIVLIAAGLTAASLLHEPDMSNAFIRCGHCQHDQNVPQHVLDGFGKGFVLKCDKCGHFISQW